MVLNERVHDGECGDQNTNHYRILVISTFSLGFDRVLEVAQPLHFPSKARVSQP